MEDNDKAYLYFMLLIIMTIIAIAIGWWAIIILYGSFIGHFLYGNNKLKSK